VRVGVAGITYVAEVAAAGVAETTTLLFDASNFDLNHIVDVRRWFSFCRSARSGTRISSILIFSILISRDVRGAFSR
jgi:hypothetical protein